MANRILAGYVAPNDSNKYELLVDHDGPTSYLNSGTFGTSGDQINASDFGLGGFEVVGADVLSSDNVNEIVVALGATTAGATNMAPTLPNSPGPVVVNAVLHWYTGIRGIGGAVEVANTVNLSTKYVRLRIVGV
jgi:hypothetical protein